MCKVQSGSDPPSYPFHDEVYTVANAIYMGLQAREAKSSSTSQTSTARRRSTAPGKLTAVAAPLVADTAKSFDPGYDMQEDFRAQPVLNGNGTYSHSAQAYGTPLRSEGEIALRQELEECEDWLDVLQIVQEEAEVMTPSCAAEALAR